MAQSSLPIMLRILHLDPDVGIHTKVCGAINDALRNHFESILFAHVKTIEELCQTATTARNSKTPFNLIITECQIPGGSEPSILRWQQRCFPTTPLGFVTRLEDSAIAAEAAKDGASFFLCVHTELEQLPSAIQQALRISLPA